MPALPATVSAYEPQSPPKPSVELSDQERAWLTHNQSLEIITDSDMAPYGFMDEQGHYIGVLPDVSARIEQLLGIRIQFKPVPYDTLIDLVREVGDEQLRPSGSLFVVAAPNAEIRAMMETGQALRCNVGVIDIHDLAQRNLQSALARESGVGERAHAAVVMTSDSQALQT